MYKTHHMEQVRKCEHLHKHLRLLVYSADTEYAYKVVWTLESAHKIVNGAFFFSTEQGFNRSSQGPVITTIAAFLSFFPNWALYNYSAVIL